MSKGRKSSIEEFIALSDEQRQQIFKQIEAETPQQRMAQSRQLNAKERSQWRRFKKKGRPKVGRGAKTISLTVEKELLKRADAYARRLGISRAKLVARGLQAVIGSAA